MGEAISAALLGFATSMALGSPLILRLRRLKFGQRVRADGPPEHLKKSGVPTMGGVIILIGVTTAVLVTARGNLDALWGLFTMLGFGLIGLADDFLMVVFRRSLGLRARAKLAGQVLISLILAAYCLSKPGLGTAIAVPFTGDEIDLGMLYIPFAVLVVVGSSNAVNLTDGLDGLAAGTSAIAAAAYVTVCHAVGKDGLAVFAAAIAGACMGFMWFNAHPAQVFMGDTGSLALGGAFGALALLSKTELLLAIIGGVFVIETLSVMLQVIYFKMTGGRRILKMSPIHHHFELSGWLEPKVVVRFWIMGCIFAALGVISTIWSGR